MADNRLPSGTCRLQPMRCRCRAVSLIELLVVLFIIGIMLGLLLPALSGARAKANDTMCMNHLRNVQLALRQSINTTKRFPLPNRWTIDILRWIEEDALYRDLKDNFNPNAEFPRPAFLRCPYQEDFPSRVTSVGFCHFILTVNRPLEAPPEKVPWELHDRELLSDGAVEQPWFIAPEQDFEAQQKMFTELLGPHPEGKYMTSLGELVP